MSIYYKSNLGEGDGNWGYGLKRGRGGAMRGVVGVWGRDVHFSPGEARERRTKRRRLD